MLNLYIANASSIYTGSWCALTEESDARKMVVTCHKKASVASGSTHARFVSLWNLSLMVRTCYSAMRQFVNHQGN